MTAKRWIVRRQETERAASLARVLGISPTVAALLLSRGCDDSRSARAFLEPTYAGDGLVELPRAPPANS